ncbi:DMT family transporter [Streptomyces coelicoflavus]|uniref:DMT family transporter n=1 Tax=Streptomyces coelicoflavus TaxID=285562 RepID=UPI0024ADF241|nr:DMT family transporter [Streptomyces coelicoflavus]MDI6521454.1 DMT family transporter [Streptomyces coelicoflavus]
MDPEVGGDLFQRDAGLAVARDPHDVLAELLRIRLGHCNILPGRLSASQVSCHPTLQQSRATTAASGSPLAATWLNFLVGAVFLGAVWGVRTLVRETPGHPLPTSLWVYLGGLCGVVFIGASAFLVRRIGVLLLSMASVAGQLAGSIALDFLVPSGGRSPSVLTILGALLTFAAVWVASRRPRGTTAK